MLISTADTDSAPLQRGKTKRQREQEKWFLHPTPSADGIKLLLFPYAGGSPTMFLAWQKHLPQNIGVYPVQYPFRGTRSKEPMPDSVQRLAEAFVTENPAVFSGKFALFGHCAGAAIAYEVIAAAKVQYGVEPEFLIASGAEPPHFPLTAFAGMEQADDKAVLQYLIKAGFLDAAAAQSALFRSYYLPIIRADFQMMFAYRPTAPGKHHFPIHLFYGDADPIIKEAHLSEWQQYTDTSVMRHCFSGGHYYFNDAPDQVCREITALCSAGDQI